MHNINVCMRVKKGQERRGEGVTVEIKYQKRLTEKIKVTQENGIHQTWGK